MSKARIVIVEDEELVRLAIQTYLENVGFEVPLAVGSGEELISRLGMVEPDLILMDVRLSGKLDGLKTAAIIKETFPVPVIYLTAYSDAETLRAAKMTDPYGYILKPFDERSLFATIEMVLHKAKKEKEISRAKAGLSSILSSVGEGIIVTGINGIVEYMNPYAMSLLGISDELPSLTSVFKVLRLSDCATGEAISLRFEDVVMGGRRIDIAGCAFSNASGGKVPGSLRIEPHRDEGGAIRGAVLVFRDKAEKDRLKETLEMQLRSNSSEEMGLRSADTYINGYKLSYFALPSSFGSGAAFEALPIDGESFFVYLTDIMGYGIRAAALTFLINKLLSLGAGEEKRFAFLDVEPNPPERVIAKLNTLFSSGAEGTFFTIIYGVVDSAKDRLRLVRAGHAYPLVRYATGEVEEIRSEGFAVGITGGAPAKEIEVKIDPGSAIFFYTDGITDCKNAKGERFSKERLIGILRETRELDARATISRIRESVESFNEGAGLDDDAVCIVFSKAT